MSFLDKYFRRRTMSKNVSALFHILWTIHETCGNNKRNLLDVGKLASEIFWEIPSGYRKTFKHSALNETIWAALLAYRAATKLISEKVR